MNKRTQTSILAEAQHRVRMRVALEAEGFELNGDESTALLTEMVLIAFAPTAKPFIGLSARAKEAME